MEQRICLLLRPTRFNAASVAARTLRDCVTPYVNVSGWYGNIDPFSIDYAFRPRLRSRLTLFRLALNRNPWAYGGEVSSPLLSLLIPTFSFPATPRPLARLLLCHWNAPLPRSSIRRWIAPEASVSDLMPANFRRQAARPVSYYALF